MFNPCLLTHVGAIGSGSVILQPLFLSASTVAEDASVGAVVGAVLNAKASGSTLSLADDAGGLFAVDGTDIEVAGALDYETATSHNITIRETNAGYSNSPRDTVVSITVTNVLEVTLGALNLDDLTHANSATQGTKVGTITGTTAGGTVTLLSQEVANAYQKDGGDIELGSAAPLAAGERDITLRETHPDGSNSPRDTVLTITSEFPNIVVGGGTFDNATGWTLAGGQEGGPAPTISGGTLNFATSFGDDASARCTATETIVAGTYRVSGTVTSYTSGVVGISVGGGVGGVTLSAAGAFSQDIVATAANQLINLGGSEGEAVMSIDNLDVHRIA